MWTTYPGLLSRVNRGAALPSHCLGFSLDHMGRSAFLPPSMLVFLLACSGGGDPAPEDASAVPRPSEVVFQAVDAGTGGPLADQRMTVRYLVRAPITLDAASVKRVPAAEPYAIRHRVARDSLVVEVRLEAPSYHRLDTALSAARGRTSGPHTIRMARRLDRPSVPGRTPSPSEPPSPGPSEVAVGGPPPAGSPEAGAEPSGTTPPDPAETAEETAVSRRRAGDRAFERGDWAAAVEAYARLSAPSNAAGPGGMAYHEALVRKGVAHMRLDQWDRAVSTLLEAVSHESAGFAAHLRLAEAQCGAGEIEAGLRTLARIAGLRDRVPPRQRSGALLLAQYQRGVCLHRAFERSDGRIQTRRAGNRALRALNSFVDRGERLSPAPAPLDAAIIDARERVRAIRERLGGRGGG